MLYRECAKIEKASLSTSKNRGCQGHPKVFQVIHAAGLGGGRGSRKGQLSGLLLKGEEGK